MPTLVLDPSFAGLDELLERRRRLGQDRHDEVWDGVLHVSPDPTGPHVDIQAQIITILYPLAKQADLWATIGSNFGTGPRNYRVPDGPLHRERPLDLYMLNVALVLEVVSPHDESWKKLPFYGSCGVEEALIVDPKRWTVDWLRLNREGGRAPIARSTLITLGPKELRDQLDWPPIT